MPPKKQRIEIPISSSSASSSSVVTSGQQGALDKITSLSNYINDIIVSAEDEKKPPSETDNEVNMLITQITNVVQQARTTGQIMRGEMQEKAQATEISGMEMEERNSTAVQIAEFMSRFKNIINGTTSLTYGQRARLFRALLSGVDQIVNEEQYETIKEPNHLYRLREIWTIMLEQFGILMSDMKKQAPEIARQSAALFAASLMAFNYLPQGVRIGTQSIPLLGSLFRLTELARPYSIQAQNSVAVVTMIYYFLRNSGIDTTDLIGDIGTFTRECLGVAANTTCSFITNNSNKIFNFVANSLSKILLPPDLEDMDLSTISDTTENTQSTQASILSVESLLNNNDVQVNMPEPPPIDAAEVVIPVVNALPPEIGVAQGSQVSSQLTLDIDDMSTFRVTKRPRSQDNSQISQSSEESLISGGRKRKTKNKGYIKSKKTKKVKKIKRKQRKTKKNNKNSKTLKK